MREITEDERVQIKVKILEAIYSGLGKVASAESAGIDYDTMRNWINKDPVFASEFMKARAAFAKQLIPKAVEKEPFKMLKSMYPSDYIEDAAVQINVDNRQLIAAPSEKLLELLENADGQRQDPDQE